MERLEPEEPGAAELHKGWGLELGRQLLPHLWVLLTNKGNLCSLLSFRKTGGEKENCQCQQFERVSPGLKHVSLLYFLNGVVAR